MAIQPEKKSPPPPRPRPNPFSNSSNWWVLAVLIVVLAYVYYSNGHGAQSEISYGLFRRQLDIEKNVESVNVQGAKVYGVFKKAPLDPETKQPLGKKFETTLPPMALSDPALDRLLREQLKGDYKVSEPTDNTMAVLLVYLLIPVGLLLGVWFLFRRARDSFFSGGLTGGFTKSGARRYDAGDRPITFDDVAGLEGVKNDLQEVVQFLRNPGQVPAPRRPRAEGDSAHGATGYGQDPVGPGRGGRGGRPLLFHQRLRVHPDVRGRGRRPRPRFVQHGQGKRPRHSFHR